MSSLSTTNNAQMRIFAVVLSEENCYHHLESKAFNETAGI